MSTQKLPILIVALLIAGVTVFVARSMMSDSATEAVQKAKEPPAFEILVVAKDLSAGTLLTSSDLLWKKWPKEGTSSDYAIKGEKEKSDYTGTVVRYGMKEGEPIMEGRTVRPGEQGFMAAALAPGMRAVSIAITPVSGVAGFVFPGDRVDIIVTHLIGGSGDTGPAERRVSETVLKNLRVLALDQKMNDQVSEPTIAQIATIEVLPKQAETVALVAELGTISLALRSIANDTKTKRAKEKGSMTWDSDIGSIFSSQDNQRGAVHKVLVIRGDEATEALFDKKQP